MVENSFELTPETARAQLAQLNEKVRFYVSKLWQTPFAYLAATGVLYVKADPDDPQAPVAFIAALLIGFGLLVSASTFHIRRRINQTVDDIAELENILSLRRTVVHWNWAMISPYFAMIAVGIIASLAAIIWTR